jgi:uncharacterized protein YkwD
MGCCGKEGTEATGAAGPKDVKAESMLLFGRLKRLREGIDSCQHGRKKEAEDKWVSVKGKLEEAEGRLVKDPATVTPAELNGLNKNLDEV